MQSIRVVRSRRSISHKTAHTAAITIATAAPRDQRIVTISIVSDGVIFAIRESNGPPYPCQLQHVFRSQENRYWTKVLLTTKSRFDVRATQHLVSRRFHPAGIPGL